MRFEVSGTTNATFQRRCGGQVPRSRAAWLVSRLGRDARGPASAGELGMVLYVSGSWTGAAPVIGLDNLVADTPASVSDAPGERGVTAG